MANSAVISENGHPIHSNSKDFLLLSRADVSKLPKFGVEGTLDLDEPGINDPVAYGSTVLVKDGGNILTYILFPDNEWTEI